MSVLSLLRGHESSAGFAIGGMHLPTGTIGFAEVAGTTTLFLFVAYDGTPTVAALATSTAAR